MAKIRLGYLKCRGLAQVPRLLLAYTKAEWDDVQYDSQGDWFKKDKSNLGF
jgi:hypothetical protein